MIGYRKPLTGQLGNKLFQLNFMLQLSKRFSTKYFYTGFSESDWFNEMSPKKICWHNPFKKNTPFSNKDIIHLGKDSFLNEIENSISTGKNIVLEPPILGDLFFDYLFFDPNDCISINKKYLGLDTDEKSDLINIAIHYRGADFIIWNKNAILSEEYYINSIDSCLEKFGRDKTIFSIFTDDFSLGTLHKTIGYLKNEGINFRMEKERLPILDFVSMSTSDVIISSPSTFCIWAGILGKNKKIIHSKSWVTEQVQNDDRFWISLLENKNDIYKIWEMY